MVDRMLEVIAAHPASRHGVFTRLAERKLPPETLARFLREMGAFCAASRPAGNVLEQLGANGLASASDLAREIFASEAGHGTGFAEMAQLLLNGSGFETQDWCQFDDRSVTPETRMATHVFRMREGASLAHALYSLGVMLPLEMAAHRQIIPGEVDAFIERGHYGLTLDRVGYLAEHAGEQGAERIHEDTIITLLRDIRLTPDQEAEVMRGCTEFLDALQGFYDALDRLITE